jgi:aldose 1-epimerase
VTVTSEAFGHLPDGRPVQKHWLRWPGGLSVAVIDHGAAIASLQVPVDGTAREAVLGFDTLSGYVDPAQPYLGATVGRFGNRIAHGRFTLDGRVVQLATNNGPNHLHGGVQGFDKQLWSPQVRDDELLLRLDSPDGDQGYPGRLQAEVAYRLVDEGRTLQIDYLASCDAATLVNLTNHMYLNLDGQPENGIGEHRLQLNAGHFLPVDETLIPLGEQRAVDGTPMDFREPRRIAECIAQADDQLRHAGGYDHTWVIEGSRGELRPAARLWSRSGDLRLTLNTTQPGLQFYSGNFLDGTLKGRGGQPYRHRAGLCLEPQGFPDAPNQPGFPSAVLRPGETYRQRSEYRFDAAR